MLAELSKEKILSQNLAMSPVNIQLELTEACNLQCRFCYNSQQPIMGAKHYEIIDRLLKENVMEIVLTGGEPMLHPEFLEILERCTKEFIKVQIQTNGTYITPVLAKRFEALGVHSVNISLHGAANTNDYLTKIKGSYQKALDGMKAILSTQVILVSNFVLTNKNIDEFPAHVDFLHNLGVRSFTLTRFSPTGIGSNAASLAITKEQLLSVLDFVHQKHQAEPTTSFLLANSIPRCVLPRHLQYHCNYCHFGASRFYIDVNGNVLTCGMSRVRLGNILENTFKEIKSHSKIYHDQIIGESFPEKCKTCADFTCCRGGCRAAALSATGDYSGKDPLIAC